MARRDVTRNSRGQIISYEIIGEADSTVDSLEYGVVELAVTDPETGTMDGSADRYEVGFNRSDNNSYSILIDRNISDTFRRTFSQPDPAIQLGNKIDVGDYIGHEPELDLVDYYVTDGNYTTQIRKSISFNLQPQGLDPFGFPGLYDGEIIQKQGSIQLYQYDAAQSEWNLIGNNDGVDPNDP